MRFFADECADRRVLRALERLGHEVITIPAERRGQSDERVLGQSLKAQGVLITADKDFGALIFERGLSAQGVFLLRSADPDRCRRAILDHLESVRGAVIVITDRGVRVRSLPEA